MSRPLHVGLDLVFWEPDSGGSATYAKHLIEGLLAVRPDLRLTAWVGLGAPDGLDVPGVDWVRLPLRSSGSPAHVAYELALMGLDARRRGIDVVHGLAYATPVVSPGVATVVTILDLTWWHHPEAATRRARWMFRLLTETCGRAADRVIAISEAARDDLVRTAGIPSAKIDVTPLGVAAAAAVPPTPVVELRDRLGLPEGTPVILFVGQVVAHKNVAAVIRALPGLPEARLVVAGRATPHRDELEALAGRLGVEDRVRFTGFVRDGDLEGLFELADCLALPSLSEGFGLPVLEAMRRGVPVVCAGTGAPGEVAGDAALTFDPRDDDAVLAALRRILSEAELRAELARRGRARAAALTWERTAQATLASYQRALGRA